MANDREDTTSVKLTCTTFDGTNWSEFHHQFELFLASMGLGVYGIQRREDYKAMGLHEIAKPIGDEWQNEKKVARYERFMAESSRALAILEQCLSPDLKIQARNHPGGCYEKLCFLKNGWNSANVSVKSNEFKVLLETRYVDCRDGQEYISRLQGAVERFNSLTPKKEEHISASLYLQFFVCNLPPELMARIHVLQATENEVIADYHAALLSEELRLKQSEKASTLAAVTGDYKCYNCGLNGHRAKNCKKPKKNGKTQLGALLEKSLFDSDQDESGKGHQVRFLLDSAAPSVVKDMKLLNEVKDEVYTGVQEDGSTCVLDKIGRFNGSRIVINDVRGSSTNKKIEYNLLSVGSITKQGKIVIFGRNGAKVYDEDAVTIDEVRAPLLTAKRRGEYAFEATIQASDASESTMASLIVQGDADELTDDCMDVPGASAAAAADKTAKARTKNKIQYVKA